MSTPWLGSDAGSCGRCLQRCGGGRSRPGAFRVAPRYSLCRNAPGLDRRTQGAWASGRRNRPLARRMKRWPDPASPTAAERARPLLQVRRTQASLHRGVRGDLPLRDLAVHMRRASQENADTSLFDLLSVPAFSWLAQPPRVRRGSGARFDKANHVERLETGPRSPSGHRPPADVDQRISDRPSSGRATRDA